MGYQDGALKYVDAEDITLFGSAARTATTNGDAVDTGRGVLRLTLDVTAVSGTPTLDVEIQTRKDSTDAWRAIASFAQKTGVSSERKCFSGCDRQVRAVATIGGGTPSLTFSVSGDAV